MTRTIELVLLGAGGHAHSCIDVIEQHGQFAIAGLIGAADEVGRTVLGYPVIGTDASLPELAGRYRHALVTVGQITKPEPRIRLFETLQRLGWVLPTIVSPRAYVSAHATIGEGTIVMHGAVINANASVGRNCIINSMSLIEHDATIEDHCHVATAAAVNGGVRVGAGTFLGSQCSVRENVVIAQRCVIGMGQTVIADCAAGVLLPGIKRSP